MYIYAHNDAVNIFDIEGLLIHNNTSVHIPIRSEDENIEYISPGEVFHKAVDGFCAKDKEIHTGKIYLGLIRK